jgi:hypothetical protein
MNDARKLARIRTYSAIAPFATAVLVPWAVYGKLPMLPWLAAGIGITLIAGSTLICFHQLFRWHPHCPKCMTGGAMFTHMGHHEHLVCPACGYDEPTGYS